MPPSLLVPTLQYGGFRRFPLGFSVAGVVSFLPCCTVCSVVLTGVSVAELAFAAASNASAAALIAALFFTLTSASPTHCARSTTQVDSYMPSVIR
jgi:hypothetical protein